MAKKPLEKPVEKKSSAQEEISARADAKIPAQDITRMVKTITILIVSLVISMIATFISLYLASSSKTVAIAVDSRGVVVPVIALTDPLLSESRVIGFTEECLRRAFSHDFLHFDVTIPQAQDCFTPASADKFVSELQPFLKIMETKRMVMAVTIPRPARVVRVYTLQTASGTVVHWDIQAEIELYFEGRNERIPSSRQVVKITVKRVPLEGTPRGILIDKFSVGPPT